MKKVVAIQTVYEHWSKFSGYHWFIPYLSKEFNVDLIRVHYGVKWYCKMPILKMLIRRMVGNSGLSLYSPNDLEAEVCSIIKTLFSQISVIHFLDGEHGYACCAYLLNQINPWFRKKSSIIASFHLPPFRLKEVIKRTEHLKLLDKIVLVGSNQYDFFRKYVSEDSITLIPHGVNTDYFSPPQNRKHENRDKFICLSVGYHLRNYSMLLEVAVMLKDLSHIQFRIISSSAKLINVRLKNVFIERSISDKDLLEAYQNADLLAMPLVDVTANNVIMEAMATGLPILTTDVGAVRDYIDRDYGILVPANRPKIFAEALVALAEKPKLCQKMGQKARMMAKEKYDWKKLAPLYEALYIEDMV